MKKIFLYISVLAISFTSCDKKEAFENDSSFVVDAAGEWSVQYDHVSYGSDPFDQGFLELLSYNTSADISEMWIAGEFYTWDIKNKVTVDLNKMTFSGDGKANYYTESWITGEDTMIVVNASIKNGKIFKDAVIMPSGATTDSLSFVLSMDSLSLFTGIVNDSMLVNGYRHTGFAEDALH